MCIRTPPLPVSDNVLVVLVAFHSIGAVFFFYYFFFSYIFFDSPFVFVFLLLPSFKCAFRSKHTHSVCTKREPVRKFFHLRFDAVAINCDEDVDFIVCKIISSQKTSNPFDKFSVENIFNQSIRDGSIDFVRVEGGQITNRNLFFINWLELADYGIFMSGSNTSRKKEET